MRANERTDERVAQYLRLDSCLFQTTVRRRRRRVLFPRFPLALVYVDAFEFDLARFE